MKALTQTLGTLLLLAAATTVAQANTPLAKDEVVPVYGDIPERLNLATVLSYALENNHDIRQARETVEEQEGVLIEARGLVRPTVSAAADYTELDTSLSDSGNFFPPTPNDWSFQLQVTQPVYAGGALRKGVESRKARQEASLLALEAVINDVILEVKTRYYDLLLARERIEVEDENVRLLQEQLADERDRFKAGNVSQFEVLRAEVELATAQPDLIRARNSLNVAGDRLREVAGFDSYRLTGEFASGVPQLDDVLSYEPVSFDLKQCLETAYQQRPELQQLALLVEASEKGVAEVAAGLKPRVDVFAAYRLRKSGSSVQFSNSLDGWAMGVSGSWNLFDSGTTKGRVQQAESRVRQASITLDQVRLSIEVELREAWSACKEAEELVGAAERVVEQAREALRLAEVRYKAGAATQLDVLESQVNLTEANNQQIEAYYSHNIATARMQKAMGLR